MKASCLQNLLKDNLASQYNSDGKKKLALEKTIPFGTFLLETLEASFGVELQNYKNTT
jgi:hypothetical protein